MKVDPCLIAHWADRFGVSEDEVRSWPTIRALEGQEPELGAPQDASRALEWLLAGYLVLFTLFVAWVVLCQ